MISPIWIALTGVMLAGGTAMTEQAGERMAYHDPLMRIIEQLDEEVGLREEQRQEIAMILARYHAELREYREGFAERAAEIGEEMKRAHESGDAEAQRAAGERMRKLRAEEPSIRKVQAEIGALLDPEQRARYTELLLEERVKGR